MVSGVPGTTTLLFVLLVAVAGAGVALWVLRPLWPGARAVALALATGVVGLAVGLYLLVGTPAALGPGGRPPPATMAEAITQLEAELARNPRQAEGWRLLARAYRAQGRAGDAADAAARAADLLPDDPDVLVEAMEARALTREDRLLDARSVAWLEQALALEPMHQRARWFRGIAHRQAGDPAAAAATWAPLLPRVDAATAASLREQIDLARAEAGLPPLPASAPAEGPGAGAISVAVSVDPALQARIPAGATLYVLARPAGGPPMPLAVERLPAAGLPATVVLDDADGLMPTQPLSRAGSVEVLARISASGDATPRPGDLASAPVAARPGTSVEVVVAHVVE